MRIKGCLRDIKFAEILRIIDKQTGRLCIYNSNASSEWVIHENKVFSVRVNEHSLTSHDEIFKATLRLSEDCSSLYIFYPLTSERLTRHISIPVAGVIAIALDGDAEIDAYRGDLPHPHTKFALTNSSSVNLSGELERFWSLCSKYLHDGFSAQGVAEKAGLKTAAVQFAFYKLRAIGVIQPVRLSVAKNGLALAGHKFLGNGQPLSGGEIGNGVRKQSAESGNLIRHLLDAINLRRKS